MFVLFIAMMVAFYMHDDLAPAVPVDANALLSMVILPRLAIGLMYLLLCRVTLRRLFSGQATSAMRWMDRLGKLFLLIIFILFLQDMQMGLLVLIRQVIGGDLILIDELIMLLPSLAMIIWGWLCYFPIDHRLREAAMMSKIDAGLPAPNLCSRGQFVLSNLRHQVAIVLAPLLLLRAWGEGIHLLPELHVLGVSANPILAMAGAGGVLLFAPVILRYLWDTVPLPPGDLRTSLVDLCTRHKIRVRQLLLWRTYGSMINAAVMGMIPSLRYILLTDALLDNVPAKQVEAVMAHEIGHVRRRHMFWLIAAAAALLVGLEIFSRAMLHAVATGPILPGTFAWFQHLLQNPANLERTSMIIAMAGWFFAFGWVSRRFERQADTFAVQHLAQRYGKSIDPNHGMIVDPHAAITMIQALQQIADLNHIPIARNSWRHGSIKWRQDYLESIIGRPLHLIPIDDHMLWIKLGTATTLIAAILFETVVAPML